MPRRGVKRARPRGGKNADDVLPHRGTANDPWVSRDAILMDRDNVTGMILEGA
jgi:hypothetical protein